MDYKNDFIHALLTEGELALDMGGTVGTIPTLNEAPATDSDALKIIAQSCVIINNQFLKRFEGVNLIDFLLRGTQRAAPNIGALLASLEYKGDSGLSSVQSPVKGGVYYGYFDDWRVKVERNAPEMVQVYCNKQTEELSKTSEGVYTVKFPIPVGFHAALISVVFLSGEATKESVEFTVRHWEDMPVTFTNGEIVAQTADSTVLIDDMAAIMQDGEHVRLERQELDKAFRAMHPAPGVIERLKVIIGGKTIEYTNGGGGASGGY